MNDIFVEKDNQIVLQDINGEIIIKSIDLGPQKQPSSVNKIEADPAVPREHYWKARYLMHQRFATPFVIVIFTCFGLVLGVTDPRSGKSRAYIGAIAGIIFGYVIVMGFKWFAEKGTISAPIAEIFSASSG
jgi:lipopolysaccharide export LptBFGC system permease protein LptF